MKNQYKEILPRNYFLEHLTNVTENVFGRSGGGNGLTPYIIIQKHMNLKRFSLQPQE
jgi:hypothetical protein